MRLWYEGPLASFHIGATGSDVERDRIVSAVLVRQADAGAPAQALNWLVEPGLPTPEPGPRVQGIGDGQIRAQRKPARIALEEIARALGAQACAGVPLVVMDAPYHLTLLDRELTRHRGQPLADYLVNAPLLVLDPQVLDTYADRGRDGRRPLADLCTRYGVERAAAPHAAAEAGAALEVVRALGRRHPAVLGGLSPAELHLRQAMWHATQARGSRTWFDRADRPEQVDTAWPVRPERCSCGRPLRRGQEHRCGLAA
jgi:DNA polymerase-3 subunit epsilon